ncbi:hypothetical protein ACRALDRAFT_207956 [Sodiomyces alcalophilus JCM 7366]|uniref:uncharacterized protein n=1 Tax=Sodiomyces alcalophilus JCM 7366 TaxID=591952 RepID=UPI0039B4C5EC
MHNLFQSQKEKKDEGKDDISYKMPSFDVPTWVRGYETRHTAFELYPPFCRASQRMNRKSFPNLIMGKILLCFITIRLFRFPFGHRFDICSQHIPWNKHAASGRWLTKPPIYRYKRVADGLWPKDDGKENDADAFMRTLESLRHMMFSTCQEEHCPIITKHLWRSIFIARFNVFFLFISFFHDAHDMLCFIIIVRGSVDATTCSDIYRRFSATHWNLRCKDLLHLPFSIFWRPSHLRTAWCSNEICQSASDIDWSAADITKELSCIDILASISMFQLRLLPTRSCLCVPRYGRKLFGTSLRRRR